MWSILVGNEACEHGDGVLSICSLPFPPEEGDGYRCSVSEEQNSFDVSAVVSSTPVL